MGIFDELMAAQPNTTGTVPGIVTGIVKENWDKDHPGMIKVEYSLGEQGKNLTGWVPVAVPYAGNEYGFYALPEVGDEVVLAFVMGDRNCPIVIGSIWSQKNALPKDTAVEKNTVKRARTKAGCQIVVTEESGKERIEILTPKELKVVLEDEKGTIEVGDKDGKTGFTADTQNGILSLKADKTIELAAGNVKVTMDGQGQSLKMESGKIECSASQSLKLAGNGTVEVTSSGTMKIQASGNTQVKGAVVQLN